MLEITLRSWTLEELLITLINWPKYSIKSNYDLLIFFSIAAILSIVDTWFQIKRFTYLTYSLDRCSIFS